MSCITYSIVFLKSKLLASSSNRKYLIIALGLAIVYGLLYLCGILFIQFILFFASAALFPVLLVHENDLRNKRGLSPDPSEDEQWSKTKKALDKLNERIEKRKDPAERKSLQVQKLSLESELRRLEWKVKESDMTQLYNASKGNLRRLDDPKTIAQVNGIEEPQNRNTKKTRQYLLSMMKEVRKILHDEPQESVREALTPIANDVRAHYSILKKQKDDDSINVTSNYFVVWATLSSFVRGTSIDRRLERYCSADFRADFEKLLDLITSKQDAGNTRLASNELQESKYPDEEISGL